MGISYLIYLMYLRHYGVTGIIHIQYTVQVFSQNHDLAWASSEVNIHVNDGASNRPRNLLLLPRRKETLIPQAGAGCQCHPPRPTKKPPEWWASSPIRPAIFLGGVGIGGGALRFLMKMVNGDPTFQPEVYQSWSEVFTRHVVWRCMTCVLCYSQWKKSKPCRSSLVNMFLDRKSVV